jgi:hypothetical protein
MRSPQHSHSSGWSVISSVPRTGKEIAWVHIGISNYLLLESRGGMKLRRFIAEAFAESAEEIPLVMLHFCRRRRHYLIRPPGA